MTLQLRSTLRLASHRVPSVHETQGICLPFGIGGGEEEACACSLAVLESWESEACRNLSILKRCCRAFGNGGLGGLSPKEASLAAPAGSMEFRSGEGEADRTWFNESIGPS